MPLPAHLEDCGCPYAKNGRHLISCIPAREHDAIPLRERPEYAEGQRFRAIGWQYPLRVETTINVTVEMDPAAFIEAHRAEYDDYEMESGYEDWEKPMVFIAEKVAEECDGSMFGFGVGRLVATVSAYADEVTEHPRWTREDTDRLEASRVDPNQGTLLDA